MNNFYYYSEASEQKRVLAIHDISCIGRCSLTVALPILSACGVNTGILPNAILSTHTGEFTGYITHDLSSDMLSIADHISKVSLPIDALYTGYIANAMQVDIVQNIFKLFPNALRFVDPAFADNGKLYAMMDMTIVEKLRSLLAVSDIIVPNITEAQFLVNKLQGLDNITDADIMYYCKQLAQIGPKQIIITSIKREDSLITAYYSKTDDRLNLYSNQIYDGIFHGTGDTFASSLLGCLLNNISIENSIKISLEFICRCIEKTLLSQEPLRYGVRFEQVIPQLIQQIEEYKNV